MVTSDFSPEVICDDQHSMLYGKHRNFIVCCHKVLFSWTL